MGNSITQKLKYKQSVVKFSYKYGVTKAAIKFQENRRTRYRWRKRYDGTLESLRDKSRRPNHHPNEHTKEEIKLIRNYKAPSKKKEKNSRYYPEKTRPGEKVQIDVKYVPKKCLSKELQDMGERFYYDKVFYSLEDLKNRAK